MKGVFSIESETDRRIRLMIDESIILQDVEGGDVVKINLASTRGIDGRYPALVILEFPKSHFAQICQQTAERITLQGLDLRGVHFPK